MSDKSIWKKALGLFVEFEGEEPHQVSDPGDMRAVMAETRQALKRIENQPPAKPQAKVPGAPPSPVRPAGQPAAPTASVAPIPLSSVVQNYIPKEDLDKVLEHQADSQESPDFSELYAKVCKSSISVFTVEQILKEPELQNLPRETRAKAAAVALRAMGSSVAEIVQDAYFKDQILDQAELTQRQKVQAQSQQQEAKIKAIQQEVDEFLKRKNAEIEALRQAKLKGDLNLQTWVESKLKEERRIFDIISHFVESDAENITLGENHPDAADASPVRQ